MKSLLSATKVFVKENLRILVEFMRRLILSNLVFMSLGLGTPKRGSNPNRMLC